MIKVTSWSLATWIRWLGLATLLFALVGLGLSFINVAAIVRLAVGLVVLANRMALVAAVMGVIASWQRRRWAWAAALTLAGAVALLSGSISSAVNSNAPFIIGPILVGALALALVGLPRLPRATGASAR